MPWFFSSKTFQASGFIISLSLFSPFFLLSWNELCASGMPSFRLRQTVALLQLTRYLNIPLLSMFRETPYLRGVCVCLCVCVCVCVSSYAKRPLACFQAYTDPQYFFLLRIFSLSCIFQIQNRYIRFKYSGQKF